jgi:Ca2+-binding EF-hand superfamily protein|mmetsp:Transcript_47598/g.75291  ORF Transcript_47598/g.75291 Transcript_47598/m.75291 type:complete len:295 (-) Transcript_47598:94-978(-)
MSRLTLFLFIVCSFSYSKSQEDMGTEENPFPADDDGDEGDEEEGTPLTHYEDEGHDVTEEHMHNLHGHLDGNKDGKVSVQEILDFHNHAKKVMAEKEIEEVFHEIESTKDGTLSLEEHMSETAEVHEGAEEDEKAKAIAHEKEKFHAADINGDGQLDKKELVHLMHPDTHPEVLSIHTKEEMRKKDEDGDGKISSKEWGEEEDAPGPFEDVDSNKDGFIDMEELRHFESGDFHTKDAMQKLLADADQDGDNHFSKQELGKVAEKLEDHPAQSHVMEWVFHYLEQTGDSKGDTEL